MKYTTQPEVTNSPAVRNLQRKNLPAKGATESIRVAICDHNPTIRCGLTHIFDSASDIEIVLTASSIEEVLNQSEGLDIDIIQVDIDDEKHLGFDYLNKFREKMPNVKIMVFTCCDDNIQIIGAVEMGVEGFQCKREAEPDEIIRAVREMHKGSRALAPCVTEALLSLMQSKQQVGKAGLSEREQEILDLIAKGKTNIDIAEKLYVSVRTVKFHITSIFNKLHVTNRTQAALWLL